jgi:hypothetical protein
MSKLGGCGDFLPPSVEKYSIFSGMPFSTSVESWHEGCFKKIIKTGPVEG